MKNLINYLSKKSLSLGNGPALDRRWTVGSPSGLESSKVLKFVSVLVLILTIGVGNAWGADVTYELTISGADFNTTSYAANNNEKTTKAVCTTDATKKMDVSWTSYQVMKNSTNMQWQKNKGYIYNSTDLGTINSVTITKSAGSFTTYYGTSEQPSSGSAGSGKGYFKTSVGGATGTTSQIVINFTISEGGGCSTITPSLSYASVGGTTLTVGSSSSGSPTVSGNTGSGAVTYSVTAASPAGCATVNSSTGVVTAVAAGTATITASIAANGGYCSGSATADFTITVPAYTVQFSTGTGNPTVSSRTEASGGAGITLPAGPTPACSGDGWVFMGWKETSAQSSTTTAPDLLAAGSTYYPASNCTLYAVYYKPADSNPNNFNKVTSNSANLTSGYYVIYANSEAMNNVLTSEKIAGKSVSESSSGVITSTDADIIWTIYKSGDYYQLYNASINKYLEVEGSNNLGLNTTSKGFTLYAFNTTTGQVSLKSVNQTSYQFQYYNGNFSAYGSQSTAIYFYKRGGTYNSNPTCCTPLGSITGTFTSSNLSQSSGVLTATLPSASKNANATSYRFTLYNNSDVEITHTDVASGGGDVSTTFSSPNVTAGNTYKVSVTPLVSPQGSYCSTTGTESDKSSITMHGTTAVTFDRQSGTGGPASCTNYYSEATVTITPPTRDGFSFDGYYTAVDGGGTKIINAEGTWVSSVSGYTDGSGNWIYSTSTLTLYANWTQYWYYHEEWTNSWGANVMTESADGYYWYWQTSKSADNRQFKIQKGGVWYGYQYNDPGFNCTDITNMNSTGNTWSVIDNRCAVNYNVNTNYYIIVYVPNTIINTTDNPKICAATALPETPYNVAAGINVYYDNYTTDWSNIYFRIGKKCHNSNVTMSLVPGTANLYKAATPQYDSYVAYQIADNTSWSGDANSIYTVRPGTYNIDHCTEFIKSEIDAAFTITPGAGAGTNPTYYAYTKTAGMKSHTATITAPSHGTITVAYTDVNSTSQSFTSGSQSLAHTCVLTITATPATGYTCTALTVNGAAFTSGSTHILAADATIAATFTAKTYDLTLDPDGGSGSNQTVTATYDATMPTILKGGGAIVLPTKTGYTFGGYYSAKNGGGTQYYTNTGASARTWNVDDEITLYAKWTINSHTLTWNWGGGSCSGTAGTHYTAGGSLNYGTAISYPDDSYMSKAGYTFTGWSSDATTMPDDDLTITAQWTPKIDTYKTALHTGASGWAAYASGYTTNTSGAGYSIPAGAGKVAKGATSSCEDTHYHFAGWVADDYKGSPSGHIIPASGTTDATGTTYWAVWEKEAAGGGSLTKLTSSYVPTEGDNLVIVAVDGDDKYALYQQTISSSYVAFWNFSNDAATVGADDKNYVTLVSDGDTGWYLGDATNGYVYNGSSNNLTVDANSHTSFSITWNSSGFNIVGNSRWLSCRTDLTGDNDNKYRMGGATSGNASGTALFDLYKYVGVSFEDPKAVCEACVATPSISGVELTGSAFSTTSVPVQATGASAGVNCSLAEYGFYWGGSADPTTNETASDNLNTGTFSATLTGPFTIGTTYHYRAFGTNEADNTGYSSDASFTLQNVSFSMHGHGGDAPATQVVPRGLKATAPSTPSETGYTFDGWWDNSSYTGSAWDFSTNTVGSGNVTLHAKWTEKPKYTITLNAGNGTVSADGWTAGDSPTWSKTQANGDEEITLPAASCNCAGWVFQGWATSPVDQVAEPSMTSSGASVLPASNTTYYAVYRQNATGGTTYNKITSTGDLTTGDYLFVADGGYAMQNTVNGKRMDEVSGFTSSNPSQTTDNTSLVWTIAKFNSQVVIKNGSNYLGIDADNTICMTTTPHFFTYTYNAGSSRWEFTSVTKTSYQLTYSTAAGTSYSYFCAGTSQSTAIYLYKQGAGLTGNYKTNPICSDITVTGTVSPDGSGTVTLTAGSGKSGDKVYAMYTPDEDYNFDVWSISGTGSTLGSTSAVVTEITIGSENTTVTANFVAKDWKTVTWKADGVALTGDGLGSASVKVENGFDITALPPAPAPCDDASTTFMGWVEDGDVWSGKTDDVSGVTIYTKASDFPTVTANVTYHAVWAKRNGSAAPATYAGTGVFTKITTMEELEVGAHYVLYGTKDDDASVKGAMNNTFTVEASGKNVFGASAVTISDNKITDPATTIVWKLGGTTNAYTLYSQNSSKYVEITANDTRGYTNPSSATTSFTITVSEGNFKIITNYASANNRMITIYTSSVFRSYASNTEGYTLNLYKYGNDYTYNQYLVKCCEDPELAFDGEYNYQTLVRQDIHGARGGNGSATVEQGKATLVLDYATESGGTCSVEVKKLTGGDNRSTAVAGSDCSNHTNIAINQSTKKITFDIWTYAPSYPTANGQGTYRIKITQDAASTYCASEAYYFVDVTLRDKFVDAVNGNETINVDGQSKSTSDKCKTPTEASLDADKNDDCHSTTRRFLGWVREDNMDTWYGSSSDRTRDLDDKKDDAALVAPNADIITTGSTWYAVWGIEE